MKRNLCVASLLLALSGCSSAPDCTRPDAASVVASLKPEQLFEKLLKRVSEGTQTMAIVRSKRGSEADAILEKAIESAVHRNSAEWERNMVTVWSTLDAGSLREACTAISARDEAAYEKFANGMGPGIQSRNEPVLNRAGAEVLAEVMGEM